MPYIVDYRREVLEILPHPSTAGELNYCITMLCKQYLEDHGESYTTFNALIGVLECAKLELYRRKAAIYEDGKIEENGDVW